jgi:hypothetical protein
MLPSITASLQQIVQLLLFRSMDDAVRAELAQRLDRVARRRLGRSLSIRQVDAGSCNGCELEIHALNNAFYDLERAPLTAGFSQEAMPSLAASRR